MKTCICTVIKNEQEYLDEWIKYHLELGINHIFIFEDVDSLSHKKITSKYKEVTLCSVCKVLNENEIKGAVNLKILKNGNAQHIYYKNILKYIKKRYISYDWCFVIDADEFITLQKPTENLSILNKYNEYDAVIFSWKCYGANGYIKKPNYKDKGLVDTYTKEVEGKILDNFDSFVKTCWNMKRYRNKFFYNQHYPTNEANWVNTECQSKLISICYTHIYIRHYITKSWEEYVWKLKQRGFVWGGNRNYNFFFEANPDLKSKKEELINSVEDEILVILPYVGNCSQGHEIILALNGWKKFCQFKYHFVVIGTFSEELQKEFSWVEFVHCEKVPTVVGQYTPHLDMQHKMEVAMKMFGDKYKGFIWMVDDNYAVKPFNFNDIKTIHYLSKSFTGDKNSPINYWNYDKYKTRQLLDKENLNHINYTTHYPCYFEFDKLKKLWDKYNMRQDSYVIEDIYYNTFAPKFAVLADFVRLGIWDDNILNTKFEIAVKNPNIKFMCNSVEGWSEELEYKLSEIVFES